MSSENRCMSPYPSLNQWLTDLTTFASSDRASCRICHPARCTLQILQCGPDRAGPSCADAATCVSYVGTAARYDPACRVQSGMGSPPSRSGGRSPVARRRAQGAWAQAATLVAVGVAPDLDLLCGRHSAETHSVGAAVIVASIAAWRRWPVAASERRGDASGSRSSSPGAAIRCSTRSAATARRRSACMAFWPFSSARTVVVRPSIRASGATRATALLCETTGSPICAAERSSCGRRLRHLVVACDAAGRGG